MTDKRKKVKLDDIIGIVKTKEQTNSVELKKELYNGKDKEMTCTSCDSDFNEISLFEQINGEIEPKEYSKLMLMTDREPLELWDWGLNEKVKIPTRNSGCWDINLFMRFIETRKWSD